MTETPPTAPDPTEPEPEPNPDPDLGGPELGEAAARGHVRIRAHAARLFNDGLAAARNGLPTVARDHFAACVYWYPHDLEARSALALACLESGDRDTAREHWRQVLDQRPSDTKALRGLALLDDTQADGG